MINFTPLEAFVGGLIIGLSVVLFYIANGRIAGISGIINNSIFSRINRLDNILFIVGLILGPVLYKLIVNPNINFNISSSVPLLILAGLLVGAGTKIGSGCTSGHGICGISRFSKRSFVATFIFMISAIVTVLITRLI
ncbi:MAG: YeeE/YedE family protein [Pelagibacteraceae bacterium]